MSTLSFGLLRQYYFFKINASEGFFILTKFALGALLQLFLSASVAAVGS